MMLFTNKISTPRGLHYCKPLILLFAFFIIRSTLSGQTPLQEKVDSLITEEETILAHEVLDQITDEPQLVLWKKHRTALIEGLNEEYDNALAILNQLEDIAPQQLSQNDKLIGEIYKAQAETYLNQGELEKSTTYFEKSIDFNQKIKNWEDICYAYAGLSIIALQTEDWSSMETHLNQATPIANKRLSADNDFFSTLYTLYSIIYDANGDYEKALLYAQNAVDYQTNKGLLNAIDSFYFSIDLNNLGSVLASMEEFEKAIQLFRQAYTLETATSDASPEWAITYLNIIYCYMELGDWENALFHVNEVDQFLSNFPKEEVEESYYQNINHKATIYKEIGRYQDAIATAKVAAQNAPLSLQKTAKLVTAETYLLMEKYQASLEEFKKIPVDESFRMKEQSFYLRNLGLAYAGLNNFAKADSVFTLLENIVLPNGKYPSPTPKNYLKYLWAKAESEYKKWEQDPENFQALMASNAHYEEAAKTINQIQSGYSSAKDKQFLLKETRGRFEKAIQAAFKMYEINQQPKYLLTAFQLSDQAKTILLQERIQGRNLRNRSNIPAQLAEEEQVLKRRLIFYEKKYSEEKRRAKADLLKTTKWEEKIYATNAELEALNKKLAPYLEDFSAETFSSFSEKQIEELKRQKTSLISYFWGKDQVYIFQINENITLDIIPLTEEFRTDFTQLVYLCHNVPSNNIATSFEQFTKLGHQFFQQLFPDPSILKENLIVIPDGWLSQLPFEVLLTTSNNDTEIRYDQLSYLLKETAIYYLYSTAFLDKSNTPALSSPQCLAMAPFSLLDKNYEGNLSQLKSNSIKLTGTQKELKGIAEHFNGNFQFGNGATEAFFKENASQYDLLHLAMHAKANLTDPMFGQMYFSLSQGTDENDTLFSHELRNIQLKAKLAVLSACETGLGIASEGNGIISIASHFFEAGCESVTMSLWEAQDDATSQVMLDYYQFLAEGLPKNKAIQKAKLKYLENPFHQQHPYFWAGFVHLGDSTPLTSSFPSLWLFIAFGLAGLGIGILIFAYRKKISG
jgi:CHAT domain-containing protein